MNNSNNWTVLERLADPGTSSEDRMKLLRQVESDPALLDQWMAFRVLQSWPELEYRQLDSGTADDILDYIRADESVDTGIKRGFPYVAAIALVASVILAFANIGQNGDVSDITLDDVFNLPAPTFEDSLLANL